MRLRLLLIFVVCGFSMLIAQPQYPLVSIHDIQFIDSLTLNTDGWQESSLLNDTVRVRGVVMIRTVVDPDTNVTPTMWYNTAWGTYIQDTSAQARQEGWGGLNIFQSDTTKGTLLDIADTANYVEITGIVATYGQTTEFYPLVNPLTPITIMSSLSKRPDPIQLSVTDFMNNKTPVKNAYKYSGMYVEIHNVKSGDRNLTNGQFNAYDENGNYVIVYPQSRYYRLDHQLDFSNYYPPKDGTYISSIRGIVSPYNNYFEILPIYYPEDIVIESVPPTFSDITRSPVKVGTNQADTVSVKVVGNTGSVANVQIHYRIENEDRVTSDMTQTLNDPTIYYAVIPGISKDSTLVDYYFTAVDDSSLSNFTPRDTTNGNYFYEVTNGPLSIHDVQFSPFGSGYSSYNNYEVTVHGIVTADTSDINGNETGTASSPAVYIQDGTGPWSGIRIIGTEALNKNRGDDVTVTGIVNENFGVTQIGTTGSGAKITVNATGQPLPEAQLLSTNDIDDLPDASVEAEKWEGVLVKVANVVVTNENADGNPGPDEGSGGNRNYGDILVADTSNSDLRVDLEDGGMNQQYHNYWLPYLENRPIRVYKGSSFESITGICWYAFSHYKLIPRTNDDFTGFVVGVENEKPVTPYHYKLEQNYPNPFNPSTTIEYSIAKESLVSVKIFNILGQEVKTLVSENQAPGNYNIRFNASDLSSGIYFYSLRAGNYFQVKKMILLK